MVDLQDVWTKEEYKKNIPFPYNEESENPFIFVFRNPRLLKVPIKMRGSPKIYDIPKEIVKVAQNNLKRVETNWAPYYASKYME